MKTCTFDNCSRKYEARGYCKVHCNQLRRTGKVFEIVSPISRALNMGERIEKKSHEDIDGCVVWDGGVDSEGYPKIKFEGEYRSPSRWLYEQKNGPLDEHRVKRTCGKKLCITEDHLIPVVQTV